jgi:hypothetical protein
VGLDYHVVICHLVFAVNQVCSCVVIVTAIDLEIFDGSSLNSIGCDK